MRKINLLSWPWSNLRSPPQRRTRQWGAEAGQIYFPSLLESKWHRTIVGWTYFADTQSRSTAVKFRRFVREQSWPSNTNTLLLNNKVFSMFPGKAAVPAGCLWSLRVWLRVNGVDHRIFGEDELWVAKDPDFNAIGDASFARPRNSDGGEQVYHGYVGKALVTFTIRYVILYFSFRGWRSKSVLDGSV